VTAVLLAAALTGGAGCAREPSAEPVPLSRSTPTASPIEFTPAPGSAVDQAAVAQVFVDYRKALLAKDGKTAASLMSSGTVAYYAKLKKLALTATEKQLRAQPLGHQLSVLVLRATLPAKAVRSASATQLVVLAVDSGLISEAVVRTLSVGTVKVAGDVATATMQKNGADGPLDMVFNRESGRWRLNLLPLLESTETALRQAASQESLSPARFVDSTLERQIGPDRAAEAWRPIG
jgi:hypothetical protein